MRIQGGGGWRRRRRRRRIWKKSKRNFYHFYRSYTCRLIVKRIPLQKSLPNDLGLKGIYVCVYFPLPSAIIHITTVSLVLEFCHGLSLLTNKTT